MSDAGKVLKCGQAALYTANQTKRWKNANRTNQKFGGWGGVGAGVQRKGQRACDEPVRRHFYRRLREIAVTSPEWGGPTALTIWDLDGPSVTS